uniref:Uncharacterized protein n=1 Tax=Arundo donax TaxID=35708 RepID=A0A0A9A9M0_ARUDO
MAPFIFSLTGSFPHSWFLLFFILFIHLASLLSFHSPSLFLGNITLSSLLLLSLCLLQQHPQES